MHEETNIDSKFAHELLIVVLEAGSDFRFSHLVLDRLEVSFEPVIIRSCELMIK